MTSLIGCTTMQADDVVDLVTAGTGGLTLLRAGALLLDKQDTEKNQQGLQEISDRYDVDMVTPTNDLFEAARLFIERSRELTVKIREEQSVMRSLCECP